MFTVACLEKRLTRMGFYSLFILTPMNMFVGQYASPA